jgi:UDP-N-acetylglucosamine--N-acetylmuramyl-(pentapeptide) pyrophosphoryl-undecaprenol N-acetylglucosamine transferase
VLVPFPAAVDDHQTHNAGFLVREGAALLVPDRELTVEKLSGVLGELCRGRGKLIAMAERARLLAQVNATDALADACAQAAGAAA